MRLSLTTLTVVLTLAIAGCGESGTDTAASGSDGNASAPLTLVTEPTTPEPVDVGEKGRSTGDTYVFNSPVEDPENPDLNGRVYGTLTSVGPSEGDTEALRLEMIFDLGNGGLIVSEGVLDPTTHDSKSGIEVGEEATRAIVGGSGEYVGASGTQTSTRQDDGSYLHVFEFSD